jgi:antitoxin ParD1/3/4
MAESSSRRTRGTSVGNVAADRRPPERRARKIAALRAALIEGERSGASTPFDLEAFIRRSKKRGRAKA